MSKITEEEKEKIIQLFKDGVSASKIAKTIGHSKDGVIKTLAKNGLCTSKNICDKLTKAEIEDICQMYKEKVSTKEIVKKFYPIIKSQNTILKIVRQNGITVRGPGTPTKIINENFFETIDSEEKAYIVGLLIADGYVIYPKTRTNRNPMWGITLNNADAYLIDKIKNIVGVSKKICKERNESVLVVVSKKMVNDLSKYGVIPRKSFKTFFPAVPKQFERHLIRGIFDGDGCISNGICSFFGNDKLLVGIQDILEKDIGIPKGKITKRETNGADSFSFGAKQSVLKFFHYIYDDSTIYLTRKRIKFEQLKFIADEC